MAITPGWNSQVQATGTATPMTEEACSVIAGTSNQTWEIDAAAKDAFDPSTTMTVEASENSGSSWATLDPAEFTLKYLLGRVDIDAYSSGSGTVGNITDVRISGKYVPKYTWAQARSCSVALSPEEQDASVFQDEGKRRIYGREDFSATIESLDLQLDPLDTPTDAESALADYISNETAFVFELQPSGDSTKVIRAWVKIMGYSGDFSGGSLDTASIDVMGTVKDSAMSTQSVNYWNYKT